MAVSVGSATSGENIVWILPRLVHQPGETTVPAVVSARRAAVLCYVCCYSCRASLQFWHLLSSSQLAPCPPWVQQTVQTVWAARQLALWTGWGAVVKPKPRFLLPCCCSIPQDAVPRSTVETGSPAIYLHFSPYSGDKGSIAQAASFLLSTPSKVVYQGIIDIYYHLSLKCTA